MQLIFLSRDRGQLAQIHLGSTGTRLGIAAFCLALGLAVFFAGFRVADVYGASDPAEQIVSWRASLVEQEDEVEAMREQLRQNLDALALRLGQMNAHVVRLDALGERLTQMAGLENGEFDFSAPPSLGGPEEEALEAESLQMSDFEFELNTLDYKLTDRGQQLEVLEDFLLNRKLHDEGHPEGQPVLSGYISSGFGQRTDPFTGRATPHRGIDFAGREGAEVVSVASGVVTWSGDRYDYGQMVEINHGNGYTTRYAHNSENLVTVGETVKRGQQIARMGDTGRATGPNLHFEVLHNGQKVNPLTFIK